MRTFKIISICIFSIALIASCTPYNYLERASTYHLSPRGAFLTVETKVDSINKGIWKDLGESYRGELISIDSDSLFLLIEKLETKRIMKVAVDNINDYSLRYAQAPSWGWTIPAYTAFTISHGLFLIFTMPLNLIATTWIVVSGNRDYRLNSKTLALEDLYKYARFPQGLPEGVSLEDLINPHTN